MRTPSPFLQVGLEAVKLAEEIILKHYSSTIQVDFKSDHSPVTLADKQAEDIIIQTIKKAFPDHAILGEEFGKQDRQSEYLWVIDPIDGTSNYTRTIPLFGTLLALMKGDEVILGISNTPMMKELLFAEKGHGAYCNNQPISVSKVDALEKSYLSFGSMHTFEEKQLLTPLVQLHRDTTGHRGFGDCWSYHLLAQGKIDMMVEARTKIWDIAAFSCIVTEAGGVMTDISGKAINRDTNSSLATNGLLHNRVLEYFGG